MIQLVGNVGTTPLPFRASLKPLFFRLSGSGSASPFADKTDRKYIIQNSDFGFQHTGGRGRKLGSGQSVTDGKKRLRPATKNRHSTTTIMRLTTTCDSGKRCRPWAGPNFFIFLLFYFFFHFLKSLLVWPFFIFLLLATPRLLCLLYVLANNARDRALERWQRTISVNRVGIMTIKAWQTSTV